jgi:hypothetical protein
VGIGADDHIESGEPMPRTKLWPIVAYAIIAQVLAIVANAVITLVTHQTRGPAQWALVNVISVVFAIVAALVQSTKPGTERPSQAGPQRIWDPYRRMWYYPPPQPVRRRGTPLLPALLVIVLVVGVGGFAVTEIARYAVS